MSGVRPFTNLVIGNQISVLRRLHGMLAANEVKTREEFGDLMKAAFVLGSLELRALSDDLGFNFSSVYRWSEGRSAPHSSLWPVVVKWIMIQIEKKVAAYEDEVEAGQDRRPV